MSRRSNLDKTLRSVEYLFRWTGMNLETAKKSRYENRKNMLLYIFNFVWLNTDIVGAICWFVEGIKKGKSLTSLTYVAPCFTFSILADLKSIYFIANRGHVNQLLATLRRLELRQMYAPEIKKKQIIKQSAEYLHTLLRVLNIVNWFAIISFPLTPLCLIVAKYVKTGEFEPLLPFLIVYPFDPFNIRVWPFVYIRQIWSEMIVVLEVYGVDYLFYTCSQHICMQFRLLQHDLSHMTAGRPRGLRDEAKVRARFIALVRWHLTLIRCVEHLEAIYSMSTLFNFVSSSALICLTGFNVTTADDTAFMLSFLSFLFMSLLQIYFLCFFGDMVMRASVGVSDAIYNSEWYTTDAKEGKLLLFMIMRAQKPCKLTAFGYAEVNLKSFMKILSTAWSYFALLKTVYSSHRIEEHTNNSF